MSGYEKNSAPSGFLGFFPAGGLFRISLPAVAVCGERFWRPHSGWFSHCNDCWGFRHLSAVGARWFRQQLLGLCIMGSSGQTKVYGGVTIRLNVFASSSVSPFLRVRQKVDPGGLQKRLIPFSQPFLQGRSLKTELRQATSASRTPPWLPSGWGCRDRQSHPHQQIDKAGVGADVVKFWLLSDASQIFVSQLTSPRACVLLHARPSVWPTRCSTA